MNRSTRMFTAIILMALSGCTTPEVLLPHDANAPAGVNFSGSWIIREADSADQRRIAQAARHTDSNSGHRTSRRSNGSRNRAGLVDVFLRMARKLKISQTPHGFFISLDRSVVQELRFGEKREISVGEIVAQRVSGWEGSVYVVETLDKKGMKLTERYWLDTERKLLYREITFRSRNNLTETMLQIFDRVES